MDKKSLFFKIGVVELRNRGAAIIFKEDEVVLIKRVKGDRTYYVFPGGGIETGETPEQATIREAYEELGVHIRIEHLLGKVEWNGIQYFFLSKIIGGTFGTGKGEEYTARNVLDGTYEPVWLHIGQLDSIDVRPEEIAKIIYLIASE